MSQRFSNYARQEGDDYPTPTDETCTILDHLATYRLGLMWEPAAGRNKMVETIRGHGCNVIGTTDDFLSRKEPPDPGVKTIMTNPPYGPGGRTAVRFVEHALSFPTVDTIVMLLQVDFDSGSTRKHLFRDCPRWAMKVVLLHRIIFFIPPPPKKPGSSTNHAWYVWMRGHRGPARIAYAG